MSTIPPPRISPGAGLEPAACEFACSQYRNPRVNHGEEATRDVLLPIVMYTRQALQSSLGGPAPADGGWLIEGRNATVYFNTAALPAELPWLSASGWIRTTDLQFGHVNRSSTLARRVGRAIRDVVCPGQDARVSGLSPGRELRLATLIGVHSVSRVAIRGEAVSRLGCYCFRCM